MTLLTIVQDAAREIGISIPSVAYGSLDFDVAQMVRLANKEGKDLVERFEWQRLTIEQTFVSLAQETQTSILPADFGRFCNETFFNRTRSLEFEGPLTAKDWQLRKALTANTIFNAYRVRGNSVLIMPVPSAGETYAFEYISKYWVDTDADNLGEAEAFTADTNTILLDEEIFTLGVIWRFKMVKGFDYAEDFRTYEARLARKFGHDTPKRTMDFASPARSKGPTPPVAPEGSWVTS
jgi:hypothetical protein